MEGKSCIARKEEDPVRRAVSDWIEECRGGCGGGHTGGQPAVAACGRPPEAIAQGMEAAVCHPPQTYLCDHHQVSADGVTT